MGGSTVNHLLFLRRVRKHANGCWTFHKRNGEHSELHRFFDGVTWVNATPRQYAWSFIEGHDVPPSLCYLRPTCKTENCINPAHMKLWFPPDTRKGFFQRIRINMRTGCWEWTAGRDQNGYGRLGGRFLKSSTMATHLALFLFKGITVPRRQGFEVCHKCNNPPCVNPRHLYVGNHLMNMRDKVEQRGAPGERNSHAVLTREDARNIFRMFHGGGISVVGISNVYTQISKKQIRKIVKREAWREATADL